MFQFLRLSAKFLAVLRLSISPIETLRVVWFLYELKSSLLKQRLLGIWKRISEQSIMTLVEGYFSLKSAGMCSNANQSLQPQHSWVNYAQAIFQIEKLLCVQDF